MVIGEDLGYAFISTMKCATNSMYRVLVDHYNGCRVGDFHCRDTAYIPRNSFVFSICRNPYARAVSIWWSTCMRGHDRYGFRRACGNGDDFQTFIVWVATLVRRPPLLQNQTEWQAGLPLDDVLHLENLALEFARLPFISRREIKLPEMNTTFSDRLPAQHYLTPLAVDAVRVWARPDFENFGYSEEVSALGSPGGAGLGQC